MNSQLFPTYRKLNNDKSYYKIEHPELMHEIQTMGSYYFQHILAAKILPERNLISDIINNEGERWTVIPEEEYNTFLKHCQNNLTLKEF